MQCVQEKISGTIDHIVYYNEENHFTVAKLLKKRGLDPIVIVGNLPNVQPGEIITCTGIWKNHSSFGKQFVIESYHLDIPKDVVGIEKYLESGSIRGIGPVFAKRIVKAFGTTTLDVLDQQPEKLLEIEGIGKKKFEMIVKYWNEHKEMRDIMIFLRSKNIGASLAKKIYRTYKEQTFAILKSNPYRLATEIHGIGFKTADAIGKEIGIENTSPLRIRSGILHVLKLLSEMGHTMYPEAPLLEKAAAMLNVDYADIQKGLVSLENDEEIHREELSQDGSESTQVWLSILYNIEKGIVKELERIKKAPASLRSVAIENAIAWVEKECFLRLAPEQKNAISASLQEKMLIITGGPGTGKSTITKAIVRIHEKLTHKIVLAAPTGRAAKRMSEITRKKARTIHSLLEMDFATMKFKRGPDFPIDADLLIIDECSMIDTFLFFSLLKATPSSCRVIFIGDVDQLPSVGPGNCFKDLIASHKITTNKLYTIFRQKKGSNIVQSAHDINRGKLPQLSCTKGSDFLFIEEEDPEKIAQEIPLLVKEKVPMSYGFDSLKDIQVLSPMRKGTIGIDQLNILLQSSLNPNSEKITWMGRLLKLHDKVMQIRNNYQKVVFNGDIGMITAIDQETQQLVIDFDDHEVVYEFFELDEIVLSYAASIHKYQGSEAKCIIIPLHTSHYTLLQRNLLYTGITRGKELVIIIGSKKALQIAINNKEVQKRMTGLYYFLSS